MRWLTTRARDAATPNADSGRDAARQRTAPVLDPRLFAGLALVALSALAGAALLGRDDDTVVVWRATRDLSVGSTLADVEQVTLPRSAVSDEYLGPADAPGGTLLRPVAAGELVPRSARTAGAPRMLRDVTVPVDPLHAPPGLLPGDAVDVWASGDEAAAVPPRLVLAQVVVVGVADEDTGLSGREGVVLSVPEDEVAAVVAATRTGELDLVAVPVASQAAPPGDAA